MPSSLLTASAEAAVSSYGLALQN